MVFLLDQTPAMASFGVLFAKTIVATVVVIALALLTIKFLVPKLRNLRRNKNSRIQILDYQALEPRKGIYIVDIAGKKTAIGVSENTIAKICDVEE